MKKYTLNLILLFSIVYASASTNVKGGIYSNTTWTKAGSPYIVTDTVVVFPNDTLTIEPGVTVKFYDKQYLEVRGYMIAKGTATDSIFFTSNSSSPKPGIYAGISANGIFTYCSFTYANGGLTSGTGSDTTYIKRSSFRNNKYGIWDHTAMRMDSCDFYFNSIGINGLSGSFINASNFIDNSSMGISQNLYSDQETINNCVIEKNNIGLNGLIYGTVKNCIIKYNTWGVYGDQNTTTEYSIIDSNIDGGYLPGSGQDSILNCKIRYNGFAFSDSLGSQNVIMENIIQNNNFGIRFRYSDNKLSCNSICINGGFDLYYSGTSNISVTHNYWCTSDSAATEAVIYDGYDNISCGLVSFMPIDTNCTPNIITSAKTFNAPTDELTVYPNPVSDVLSIRTDKPIDGTIILTNVLGQNVFNCKLNDNAGTIQNIDVSSLPNGVYILKTESNGKPFTKKILKL